MKSANATAPAGWWPLSIVNGGSHGRDALEFLPAALEIVETPPSPVGRAIAGTIVAFFCLAAAWACLGKVDIIATASGRIIPSGKTKVIQPFETGVVKAIRVSDGQKVSAGDVLVELDGTIDGAEADRLQKAVMAAELDAARLKAALAAGDDGTVELVPPSGAGEAQVALQRTLLANQVDEYRAKLANLDRQIAQSEGSRAAVAASVDKLAVTIPIIRQRVDSLKQLGEFARKLQYLEAQQDLLEHEQELQVQKGRLQEATQALGALREQRRQAGAEFKRTNLADLADAQQKAAGLGDELVKAKERHHLQTLTAPVDGTVQQLGIHTVGGVVTPAQQLMVIVPQDAHLEVEAMVSNRDIGFVHTGEPVEIKIDTFNFTKYGLLHGDVRSVSQDAIPRDKPADGTRANAGSSERSSEPQGQELVYAARVSLDRTQMEVDGRVVDLAPGMAVTAEIKTGQRRVIEYLLAPVLRARQAALRER
ncbi:MAG TPA: HlyD family type I secretion periplasmic adaptor subunit [Alphaproteobacteria bacterium]|nr:HlyD family type I secretion periplasmic adaptor subunit [Alphaproteobacteria bacterium]